VFRKGDLNNQKEERKGTKNVPQNLRKIKRKRAQRRRVKETLEELTMLRHTEISIIPEQGREKKVLHEKGRSRLGGNMEKKPLDSNVKRG